MSGAAVVSSAYVISPARTVEKLRHLMLWLAGFSGAFVFTEPSAYEIFASAAIFVFFASGLAAMRQCALLVVQQPGTLMEARGDLAVQLAHAPAVVQRLMRKE